MPSCSRSASPAAADWRASGSTSASSCATSTRADRSGARARSSRDAAIDAEKHKRIEAWRERLLTEGPAALDDLLKWRPDADRKSLQALITKATSERVDSGSREAASRELFRALRSLFDDSFRRDVAAGAAHHG